MVQTWTWHTQGDNRWLHCDLLADWPHMFGTRQSYPAKPHQLSATLDWPGDQAHWAHQVHGHELAWTESNHVSPSTNSRTQADAIATRHPTHSVWVSTADCVPALVATSHPSDPVIAAVHAGWRGTAAKILPRVIETWASQGIPVTTIKVALGPAISGPVYQVSEDVATALLHTLPQDPRVHQTVMQSDPEAGRVRIDIRRVNVAQLRQLGILEAHISVCPHCTWSEPEQFFSYRRDRSTRSADGHAQVQWSGIALPQALPSDAAGHEEISFSTLA